MKRLSIILLATMLLFCSCSDKQSQNDISDTSIESESYVESDASKRLTEANQSGLSEADISDLTEVTDQNLDEYIEIVYETTQEDYSYVSGPKTYSGTQLDVCVLVKKTLTNADSVMITQLLRKSNIEVSVRFFDAYDSSLSIADNLQHQKLRLYARENILGEDDIITFDNNGSSEWSPRRYIYSKDMNSEVAVEIN